MRTNQPSQNLAKPNYVFFMEPFYTNDISLLTYFINFLRKLFVFYKLFNKILQDCERINVLRIRRNQIICSLWNLYTPTTLISQLISSIFWENCVCFTSCLTRSYKIANESTFSESGETKFCVLYGTFIHQRHWSPNLFHQFFEKTVCVLLAV